MATITPTVTSLNYRTTRPAWIITWSDIGDSDTCTAVEYGFGNLMSVQVGGTFGSATVVLQGSNDGTTYATLLDSQGNAISKTAAGFEQVQDRARYIRPSSSGGSSSAVDVTLFVVQG